MPLLSVIGQTLVVSEAKQPLDVDRALALLEDNKRRRLEREAEQKRKEEEHERRKAERLQKLKEAARKPKPRYVITERDLIESAHKKKMQSAKNDVAPPVTPTRCAALHEMRRRRAGHFCLRCGQPTSISPATGRHRLYCDAHAEQQRQYHHAHKHG
jgi:hypothetical protein